jgi:thioredoxin reductase
MQSTDVIIIGAGPYGLSISAHLSALGVDHVIVGAPMDGYRTYSPAGMIMKSEPYASAFAAPQPGYDVKSYSAKHDIPYVDRVTPLTVKQFLDYADWYTATLVPDVRQDIVTKVTPVDGGGFNVEFSGGKALKAGQVVIATGLRPYIYRPEELSELPSDLVSHASDHQDIAGYAGKKVVVVGSGQSALETSALLHEAGAQVQIVSRRKKLDWNVPNPETVNWFEQLRWPVSQLCEGWHCKLMDTPWVFRLRSAKWRAENARTFLGPSGSWWLKDRVDGVIETLFERTVLKADAHGDGVRLFLGGQQETVVEADHIICGTGFRMDVAKNSFLPSDVVAKISTYAKYPVVSPDGESSVRGLYFAGAAAAANIGPSMRFIAGTYNLSKRQSEALAKGARSAK